MASFGKVMASAFAIFVAGVAVCFADAPRWLLGTSYANMGVEVLVVDKDGAVQLAVLDGGVQNNMRVGAFCSVLNSEDEHVGNLVVVEARSNRSVAAILDESGIKGGDRAFIKIAK